MSYNKSQALTDNINAIRTAFLLKSENRAANREEMAILEKYSGFGGLNEATKSAVSSNELEA